MTQKQIAYFEKAYHTGNIALAAEQMYVSRSVISRSIQELEEEFGVTLFERSKSGVAPTEAGKLLYSTLLQVESCFASLSNRFQEMGSASRQRLLRVGVTPTNTAVITRLLFGPFRQAFPDIQVQVLEKENYDMIAFLSQGEVDVVALPGQHADTTIFDMLPLYDVHMVLAVCRDNPLARKEKLGVMDLLFTALAFLASPLPSVERIVNASMEAVGQKPNIALRTSSIELLRELTERGLVCSVLPDDLIRDWKNVCGVPLDFSSGSSTQKLVWNKAVPLSSAASDFLDFARDYFAGKEAPEAPPEAPSKGAGGLSSNFFAELLDLPACKSKGYCDGCGRCEH